MADKRQITLIYASSSNGVIGRNGSIPWNQPADMARFKRLTMGHNILMGRKTHESLPRKGTGQPILTGRKSHVLTRTPQSFRGANTCANWRDALVEDEDLWIIGGGEIYKEVEPHADRLFRTEILADIDGDVKFEFDPEQWWLRSRTYNEDDEHKMFFWEYRRV